MVIRPDVRAEGDAHSEFERPAEGALVPFDEPAVEVGVLTEVIGPQGGHPERAVLAQQPEILLGEQRAVLDRAGPAEDGGLRAVPAIGMGGYVPAVALGLGDDDSDILAEAKRYRRDVAAHAYG